MLHPTIGMSPFFAMFGRDAPAPFKVVFALGEGTIAPPEQNEIHARLTTIWALVKAATAEAHRVEEYVYNQRHPGLEYEVGDLVMIHVNASYSRVRAAKMSFHYIGPYRIAETRNRLLYQVVAAALPEAIRQQQRNFGDEMINVGRLKKYHAVPARLQNAARNLEEVDIPAEEVFDNDLALRDQQEPVVPPVQPALQPIVPEEEEIRRQEQLMEERRQLLTQQEELLRDM